MANNYRQFAETFGPLDPAGLKWLTELLKENAGKEDADGVPMVNFEWRPADGDCIVFSDDGESGDVDQLGEYVRQYFIKFEPKKYWLLRWADTCSKARPGEFGGGLMLVTAERLDYQGESEWVEARTYGLDLQGEVIRALGARP
jgi:hypothetical protein